MQRPCPLHQKETNGSTIASLLLESVATMAIGNEQDVTQHETSQQQPSQRQHLQQFCSTCGLAPWTKPDGTVAPLKRCSRCQNAWYHDLECQRRHFQQHKHVCRKAVEAAKTATISTATTAMAPIQLYYIEARPGRGNCLVAGSTISVGQRVEPPLLSTTIPRNESFHSSNTAINNNLFWSPLVPPVLHEAQRATSCAYCFRTLSSTSSINPCRFDTVQRIPKYQVLFCSTACRETGRNVGFQQEEQAVRHLFDHSSSPPRRPGGPPQIFSTAILLYRILVALEREQQQQHQQSSFATMSLSSSSLSSETGVTLRQLLDRMQSMSLDKLLSQSSTRTTLDDDDGGAEEEEEKEQRSANVHHTQAVVATVMAMIEPFRTTTTGHNSFWNNNSISMEYLMDLVTKIKLNGFSICNGESVALGVGIFPTLPSSMNHSCYPNVLPTFSYGIPNQVPQLILTACQVIQPHQELCISYIDHACPRTLRRRRLQRDYFFFCHCEVCHNEDHELRLIGLKGPSDPQRLKQLVSYNATTNKAVCSISVEKLEATYQAMNEICYRDSWYVQESGERLVQGLLDRLSLNADDPSPAYRALSVLEDLLRLKTRTTTINGRVPKAIQAKEDSPSSRSVTAITTNSLSSAKAPPRILPKTNILRQSILTYKAAKLRLFLSPDTRQAMGELHQVQASLSPYYPENHELMTGLRECMAQAMMG
jgi:SET domain/MYND finger